MERRSSRLQLTLLGGFVLSRASGGAVPVARRKSQALLAYLALHAGQRHPRDKLATLFWPDVEDRQARQSLRQALLALRQVLAGTPQGLLIEDEAVGLEPGALDVDVADFERAVADGTLSALHGAARLYRGDLLEGLAVDESPFEEWLIGERERLRELALEALGKLLAHQNRDGQDEAAVGTALRLLALDPLQEAVHRALMRIHARQGRQDAALRLYQVCVDVLQRELSLERARVLCFDGNYLMLLPRALGHLSSAYLLAGRATDALATAREACQHVRSPFAFVTLTLAEACLADGRIDEARQVALDNEAAARRLGDRGRLAWSLLLLGEIDARSTDAAGRSAAESRLREALALAEQLRMRPVVAQCHLGLGRLLAAPAGRAHLAQAAALYRDMKMAHGLAEAERAIAVGETRA